MKSIAELTKGITMIALTTTLIGSAPALAAVAYNGGAMVEHLVVRAIRAGLKLQRLGFAGAGPICTAVPISRDCGCVLTCW